MIETNTTVTYGMRLCYVCLRMVSVHDHYCYACGALWPIEPRTNREEAR